MIIRHHFQTIDSTHNHAIQHIDELSFDKWILYTADRQTAGRGQYARKWVSAPDVNIYATYSIPFPLEKQHLLSNTAQVIALAIISTLKEKGFSPKIKWANDLLLGNKKIGGVLCENKILSNRDYSALIVSIGLNVNMSKEICEIIDQPVTSLKIETGIDWDKEEILKNLQEKIGINLEKLKVNGFTYFIKELNDHLALINETILIELVNGQIIKGIFEGITGSGLLKVILENGEIQELSSGRIVLKQKEGIK